MEGCTFSAAQKETLSSFRTDSNGPSDGYSAESASRGAKAKEHTGQTPKAFTTNNCHRLSQVRRAHLGASERAGFQAKQAGST